MGLAIAKAHLAFMLEDDGNTYATTRFDLVVGVEKRQIEPARHRTADRRLTGAHQADEKNVGN